MNKPVSSKHLEAISDLTLTAPVKSGFVDAFESVTYETRLRLVMDALFKIRATAREHSKIKPFVDTAERIQALLDFRLAVLDTEPRQLLLSATFDRAFEPYIRLIWNPLGPLLDVIFCNCEGYKAAAEHSFDEYIGWVRSRQIDTDFFYAASGHSVGDVQYLAQIERLHREGKSNPCDLAAAGTTIADPEKKAAQVRSAPETRTESNELAIEALVALYRLADFYPPDKPDGKYLIRAVQDLLGGWNPRKLPKPVQDRFAEQLAWLETAVDPPFGQPQSGAVYDKGEVQDGILASYDRADAPVTHGALLLMRVEDPARARQFIASLPVRFEGDLAGGEPYLNVGFTYGGLGRLGVPAAVLEELPIEFQQGMEERAGLLGDVREVHPRRWRLPRRWGRSAVPASQAPIELSAVDFIIQLRASSAHHGHEIEGNPRHPLFGTVNDLAARASQSGVQLLAVEPMRRASRDPHSFRDHFGFVDGLSQPGIGESPTDSARDRVGPGELLVGYPNDRGDAPRLDSDYFRNGTFLVIRKLRQDLNELNKFLDEQSAEIPDLSREDLLAKMMGRTRSGVPLLPGATAKSNDFDYENDVEGASCPFQSHIRRTNPRTFSHGRPTPRILRRGLSYGPPFQEDPDAERGVFFMAYNGSIAEQFEVIQHWVNGGNSSGVASCQSDPMMGIGQVEDRRTFRFCHGGQTFRVDIPTPFVRLEWGAYLFVPSRTGLDRIASDPPAQQASPPRQAGEPPRTEVEKGEDIIAKLQGMPPETAGEAWKAYLEDFGSKDPGERNDAPAIWAAIRAKHRGVLRVPYLFSEPGEEEPPRNEAVLVADKKLVMDVFADTKRYSMRGQMTRMKHSFGAIFLGLDEGKDYHTQADAINAKIMKTGDSEAFQAARALADRRLEEILQAFCALTGSRSGKLDLRREFITPVLADICRHWFGIPDDPRPIPGKPPADPTAYHVVGGGWSWIPVDERKPRCPGDFMATSRYCFYPDPQAAVQQYGREQGQKLKAEVTSFFHSLRAAGQPVTARLAVSDKPDPVAELGEEVNRLFPGKDEDAASVLIGIMTGFLPPADGSLRWTLYEWMEEKTLWRLQQALVGDPGKTAYGRAVSALCSPLMRAMQKRPSPDMLWRTAKVDHQLGPEMVRAGDRIVVGIVSATHQDLAKGKECVYPVFGGDRSSAPTRPHACPAYKFAMGTMLGMLSALLEKGRIEALPSPLIVKFSDWQPCPPPPLAPPSGSSRGP